MKINPQLVEWLQMNSKGSQFVLPAFDSEYMALEARLNNLIEFESVDYHDATVRYRLTAIGEIALGITDTAADAAPAPKYQEYQRALVQAHTATAPTDSGVALEALETAILAVLADSDPLADFEIREQLLEHHPDLPDYTTRVVQGAIKRLNEDGKIVFRNDKYLNKLYYVNPQAPATAQPESADTGTGYTAMFRNGEYGILSPDGNLFLSSKNVADMELIDQIAYSMNTETSALRAELAVAREQVAVLTGELSEKGREVDTMQDSIDDLNHMVDLARAERNSVRAQLAECQHAHELARTQRDAATELYSGKHGRIEELKRELEVSRDARKALEKVIQTAATYLAETNSNDENVGRAFNILNGFASPD